MPNLLSRLAAPFVHRALVAPALLGVAALGCQSGPPVAAPPAPEPTSAQTGAIVGGVEETGFEAVGAMVLHSAQYGYIGSFCTGTLVDPEWVLTAAHCLTGEGGFSGLVEPASTRFYIGPRATSSGFGGLPLQGRLVPALAFYLHPQYSGGSAEDIALVRLAEPVTDVAPVPLYDGPFVSGFAGLTLTYVGFGVTDGDAQGGGGVKRRAEMSIAFVESSTYTSQFVDQGVCFGDSGGPGLYLNDGVWVTMGVNSAVWGARNVTPCTQYAVHTRVDVHAEWVRDVIQDAPEIQGCLLDKGYCACPDACLHDGSCDESVCPPAGSCSALSACLGGCGGEACVDACRDRATDNALATYISMAECIQEQCTGLGGGQYNSCVYGTCGGLVVQCFEPNGGEGKTCAEIGGCVMQCQGSWGCNGSCQQGASLTARHQWTRLRQCTQASCQGMAMGSPPYNACVSQHCAEQATGCYEPAAPAPCNPLSDACGEPLACVPLPVAASEGESGPSDLELPPGPDPAGQCRETYGWPEGTPCHPWLPDGPECAAGLACVSGASDAIGAGNGAGQPLGTCTPLCEEDDVCEPGLTCVHGAPELPEGVGYCACVDNDGDGVCAGLDCDDDDPTAAPGLPELCGDLVDNDCNGLVDDGCEEDEVPGEGSPATPPGSDPISAEAPGGGSGCAAGGSSSAPLAGLFSVLLARLGSRRRLRSER